jgi:peptidoglycan/LPS O-acetylase OafA/YrhL
MSIESELHERTSGPRYFELDALRGLAAFIVIWHHFHAAFDDSSIRWYLRPILAGRPAVILFFLLSGYVLSLPVWRNRQPAYRLYLVRRFFRIYVPYASAVLLSLAGAHFFLNAQRPLSPFFYRVWHSPITAKVILINFLTTISPSINMSFWSLRPEAYMSVLMPFLAIGMNFLGKKRSALVILLGGGIFEVFLQLMPNIGSHLLDLHYGLCFACGALMSQNRQGLQTWFESRSMPVKTLCGILTLVLFYCDSEALCLVGAGGLVLFALHSRASQWLRTPVPEYLGWVSYSMYLVHGTVLMILLILLVGRIPIWSLALLYLICVLVVSHVFCSVIEQPALRWGRRLTTLKRARESALVHEQVEVQVAGSTPAAD